MFYADFQNAYKRRNPTHSGWGSLSLAPSPACALQLGKRIFQSSYWHFPYLLWVLNTFWDFLSHIYFFSWRINSFILDSLFWSSLYILDIDPTYHSHSWQNFLALYSARFFPLAIQKYSGFMRFYVSIIDIISWTNEFLFRNIFPILPCILQGTAHVFFLAVLVILGTHTQVFD